MADGQGSFIVGKYTVDLDLGELLCSILDQLGQREEKRLLQWLVLRLSGHEVEFARTLSAASPELGKQLASFFDKRLADHRSALRLGRLLSFWTSAAIEEEATRRALEETRALARLVSVLSDGNVQGMLSDHREMLQRLCAELIELVREGRKERIGIDLGALRRFLTGGGGAP